jgi:hypothetical protein
MVVAAGGSAKAAVAAAQAAAAAAAALKATAEGASGEEKFEGADELAFKSYEPRMVRFCFLLILIV